MKHTCHWPGCTRPVPPRMWGCAPHWFALPKGLRDDLWASYRRGQEMDKRPSPEYLAAARAIQDWIRGACHAAVPLHLVTGKEGWPAYVAPPLGVDPGPAT